MASHLQLAAQVPAQWLKTDESSASAKLAIRKVVYRAMLEQYLSQHLNRRNTYAADDDSVQGGGIAGRRLGRLPDSAYSSFPTFISRAMAKLDLASEVDVSAVQDDFMSASDHQNTGRRIEILHVLRCIAGPCVESLILVDRLAWLKESLDSSRSDGETWDAQLVSLFDQAVGSARNFALVVKPGA